jgi:hypothetical protein
VVFISNVCQMCDECSVKKKVLSKWTGFEKYTLLKCVHLQYLYKVCHGKSVTKSFVKKNPTSTVPCERIMHRTVETFGMTGSVLDRMKI